MANRSGGGVIILKDNPRYYAVTVVEYGNDVVLMTKKLQDYLIGKGGRTSSVSLTVC